MRIKDTVKLSLNVLKANKTRSFLTGLGIIIGIAAVIVIISAGAGAQSLIVNQLNSVGTNLIGVLPGASDDTSAPASALGIVITSLKYEDAEAIAREVPHLSAVSSYNTGQATFSAYGNSTDATYYGVMSSYLEVEDATVASGRFFSAEEDGSASRVVVLGPELADELFNGQDAVGQKIKIGKEFFEVIGIMKKRGVSGFQNKDNIAYLPAQTAQKILLGIRYVSYIRAKVDSPDNIEEAAADVRLTLRDRHNIDETGIDDFSVRNTKDAIKTLTTVTNALKFFLAAIAGISLLVGGIGIMNIMLASVHQRIQEIGLRKALGAKNADIMTQFLAESVAVTLLGGIIGMVIGSLISYLIAVVARYLGYDWDLVIAPSSIILGLAVTLFVGIVFGIYPAQRAAKLNAIEALRYE